jgi:predicted class III extradiol MEMO1 family dioxygenase
MTQLTLNLETGSVMFRFTPEAAQELKAQLDQLMGQLKNAMVKTAPGSKSAPQPPMEYRYTGDVLLELFCNPNIWGTPFAAKVLVTLRDERIRLNTEAELSRLIDDINQFIEQQ